MVRVYPTAKPGVGVISKFYGKLLLWVPRELPVRQPRATNDELVRANGGGCFVALSATGRNEIVLIYAVARDA